jgi:hypothetical protein
MKKRILLLITALAALAGVLYYGFLLLTNDVGKKTNPLSANTILLTDGDTLKLTENGITVISVAFDSLKQVKNGNFQLFDTLVFRTDLYSKSQLNYPGNRNTALRAIGGERQTITEFLKKAGMGNFPDSLSLRQLLFRVMLDSVKKAAQAGKIISINSNKEMVVADAPATAPAANAATVANRQWLNRLLVCAGILSLLSIAAIFGKNKNTMAKRNRKRSETEEEYLKRTVYELLGKDTNEARYFTEVLADHKRFQTVKEQLKPETRTDTGTLIANMKSAGLLTTGESKTMYELHELKEKLMSIKNDGATVLEKQQKLFQSMQSFTKDETLKQHLQEAEGEGTQWQRMMQLEEKDLPAALQQMIRYYDDKYGNGQHRLSPVYAETLRRAQLDIPENFSTEDRFLKALYEQYRNLLDDVLFKWFEQQQNPETLALARQELVNRMAQLAFHAHSFLTHYNKDTAALPPASIKANMQMVLENGSVTATLPRNAYKTYSRDITRFEREIFLQKLLEGIGVNNLENVLLKDVYYPHPPV